eukprot:2937056-Prymnesium_polylepis.1
MAQTRAFSALASSSKKHCLWVAANFLTDVRSLTDVRCRSLAAIVAAHRRAWVPFLQLLVVVL